MNPDFSQNGTWIYIDPDEKKVECIEQVLDLESLCELLRCDATELEELGGPYFAYVDGEGAWQERQTEWEFNENPCWGPMLIAKTAQEDFWIESCSPEDLEAIEPFVKFIDQPPEL